MRLDRKWQIGLAQIILGGTLLVALLMARGIRAGDEPVHMVTDWSHRHVVFSGPKSLLQSLTLARDPRYVQQWVRRNSERPVDWSGWKGHNTPEDTMHGDWNVYMGNFGTVGAGNYPAKFSFSTTTANCSTATQPDFVVYNTSLAGSSTPVAAVDSGTFSIVATANSTVTITNGANTLTLTAANTNAHTGVPTSGAGTFRRGANATASATGLAAAIDIANNGSFVGVSATSVGAVVTITATTAGTVGNSITVTESTAPASNLTMSFTNLMNGGSGVPTIVAFDNLYSGCTGTVPSTYWSYNTGTTDLVVTSPTLSLDGKQLAFIQSTSGGAASLVILRWAANSGSIASPATPTSQTPTNYYNGGTGCTAPCVTTIAFGNGAADSQSSPFYDYITGSDTLYVGDNTGNIHKFIHVFNGVPAEVTTTWPVQVATTPLSSPIYDSGTGKIFASASFNFSTNSGGALYSLCATGTACGTAGVTTVASGIMGPATTGTTCKSTGPTSGDAANLVMDAPVLDSANAVIYDVIGNDGTGKSALFQFSTSYASGNCGTEITLGNGSTTGVPVYAGTFDNSYYGGSAGYFYVCGNTSGNPKLYQIAVSSAGIASGASNASSALTTGATTCGPVTEVYNPNALGGAADWIFTSVQAKGQTAAPITCPANSGCVMSFNVTSGAALTAATATVGVATVAGGASGIVVDNTVGSGTLPGASQVYFTPLATGTCTTATGQGVGGCAIQASQSALN